jgi:twitching motility protein PilT
MNALRSWLSQLNRPEATELVIASGRRPSIKVSGAFQAVDSSVLSSEDVIMLITAVGGGRHVEALSPKPIPWSIRVDGIGVIAVVAARHGDVVQARMSMGQRPVAVPPTRQSQEIPLKELLPQQEPQRPPARAPEARRSPSSYHPPVDPRGGGVGPIEIGVDHATQARRDPREEPFSDRGAAFRAPTPPAFHAAEPRGGLRPSSPPSEPRGGLRPSSPPSEPRGGPRFASKSASPRRAVPPGVLDKLLSTARDEDASDLHIVAGRPPLLRLAGELLPQGDLIAPEVVEGMLLPRVPSRLTQALAVEGSCDFAMDHGVLGRFRVNISRQRTGYKGCFRLIARDIPTLASLGLPDAIGLATRHHQGLIVITGPTGHGKTTTLAALVDILNRETSHHIITVEDPVEYLHPRKKAMISQREVGSHTRSFESALKASLREDPDVIVVGELRDTTTVRMALAASETGHLVLGTMNTPSAAKTIDRLIDLFPPGDQQQVRVTLAGGLRLIVSQRLLPSREGKHMAAAAEVLPGSVALWNLIRDNKTFQIPSLQQRGKSLGIVRLDDSLAELVRAGKTSLESALLIAEAPDELETVLAGKRQTIPTPEPAPRPSPDPGAAARGLLGRAGALFGKKGG